MAETDRIVANDMKPIMGVVVVTFQSADVIAECLETLACSTGIDLKVVIVDNASSDQTCSVIADWASGKAPFVQPQGSPLPPRPPQPKPLPLLELTDDEEVAELGPFTLIRSSSNRGFAGGVNTGLKALGQSVDWFWVLNPDCAVPESTPRAFADAAMAAPNFALMTGRTIYYDQPDRIQTVGGTINKRTALCTQIGAGMSASLTFSPNPESLDWVTGANMLVSRRFLERVGMMREDYFLYYEEVDWSFRRGDLPLAVAKNAAVFHRGGTSIGTGALDRRATPFANYFNHRNRIRFAKRFLSPWPIAAYVYGLMKAAQLVLKGAPAEAFAVIAGMFELRPPREILDRFPDPKTRILAFGRVSS